MLTPRSLSPRPWQNRTYSNSHILRLLNQKLRLQSKESRKLWVSWIFPLLTKDYVFCEKELKLNRRLCPEIYLEVVPINKSNIIKISGKGETVEYALKMKRLPQERIMTVLLKENKVDKKNNR